ncbi:MAG: hypothetical protein K5866_00200 [Treponema sp.]|nr:hypothetical protein [Treponema sp.]
MIESIKNFFDSQQSLLFFSLALIFFILLIVQKIAFIKKSRNLRKDAIKRSKAVIGGQVAEQIAPLLPDFPSPIADARFIGKPIDFIAFPGLEESNKVKEILLIEVKTGSSALSEREKEVRRAVEEGRVKYKEYRI